MATPHNQAEMGEIAKTVLMPGDPLRAKFIAENFLENPVQFNNVRGMLGYTGTFRGKKVSVMGSGMGIPSIGIYSYELYSMYGVENIIRIGSCGAYKEETPLYQVILSTAAYSDSTYAMAQSCDPEKIQKPSEYLNEKIKNAAAKLSIPVLEGPIYSSDPFYMTDEARANHMANVEKYGLIATEMESFALFHNAKVLGKNAACIVTVSDNLATKEETTHEERRIALVNMMRIALAAAVEIED